MRNQSSQTGVQGLAGGQARPAAGLAYLLATVFAIFALVISGCGGTKKEADASKSAEGPAGAAASPGTAPGTVAQTPTVTVVAAMSKSVSSSVQVTGSFVAREISDVAPQAAGRVIETPVDVGAFVKAGQVIARLEDRDAQLRLDQAKASEQQAEAGLRQAQSRIGLGEGKNFDASTVPEVLSAKASYESAMAQARQAEADAQRYENLLKTGDVSKTAYEKARTQADTTQAQANSARQQYEAMLNSARQNFQGVGGAQASLSGIRAQLALAQKALDDTLIRAPFSGFVSSRPVAAGQYVGLQNKIATVLLITPIRLELQVPENNAAQMKVGSQVEANVPGFPNRVFTGRVTAVNPAVDTQSRTFSVIVEFPNTDVALKPGMFGTARIFLPGSSEGLFVPRQSVITDPTTNSSQVYFIRDGKARVAVVQLGETDGDWVRVLAGLSPDAKVAIDNLKDLYDGQTVVAQESTKRTSAETAKPARKEN
jgi:multidrug efflux pump subunit AcrA (membrane-fusion protein)